jgi:hypothetical protein
MTAPSNVISKDERAAQFPVANDWVEEAMAEFIAASSHAYGSGFRSNLPQLYGFLPLAKHREIIRMRTLLTAESLA